MASGHRLLFAGLATAAALIVSGWAMAQVLEPPQDIPLLLEPDQFTPDGQLLPDGQDAPQPLTPDGQDAPQLLTPDAQLLTPDAQPLTPDGQPLTPDGQPLPDAQAPDTQFLPDGQAAPGFQLPPDVQMPQEQEPTHISNAVAVFAGLDKITGRIINFDVYIDETVQFGALQVTPRVCYTRPPTEEPRTDAFVEVDEITLARKIQRVFTGWMFADSPGLHAVDNAVYDVWLTDCRMKSDVPPPSKK